MDGGEAEGDSDDEEATAASVAGGLPSIAVGSPVSYQSFSGCTVAAVHPNGTLDVTVPGVGVHNNVAASSVRLHGAAAGQGFGVPAATGGGFGGGFAGGGFGGGGFGSTAPARSAPRALAPDAMVPRLVVLAGRGPNDMFRQGQHNNCSTPFRPTAQASPAHAGFGFAPSAPQQLFEGIADFPGLLDYARATLSQPAERIHSAGLYIVMVRFFFKISYSTV